MLKKAAQIHISSKNGNQIACYLLGLRNRKTVVLTSGIGCGPVFFEEIARELARDHRVVYWDYRGHGSSDKAPEGSGYRIEDHAEDLAAVVDAFCPRQKPIMISFSMGVQVTVEWTRSHPNRAQRFVFMLGVPRNPLHRTVFLRSAAAKATDYVAWALRPVLNMAQPAWRLALRTPLTYVFARSVGAVGEACPQAKFGEFVRFATQVPLEAYLRCTAGILAHDASATFSQIKQPVLMLAAENDVFIDHIESVSFASRLGNSHFALVAGSHAGSIELGSEIAALIREFLTPTQRSRVA